MKSMKALIFKRYGGSDQIAFADIPRPAVKPDEVLVRVHAVPMVTNSKRSPNFSMRAASVR